VQLEIKELHLKTSRMCRRLLVTSILVAAVVGPISTETANAATSNCVIHVVGKDAHNNFITGPMTCYSSFSEVLQASGAKNVSDGITPTSGVSSSTLLDVGIIGTHYDGSGGTGTSVSVEGSDCSGGGLNLPGSWNDKISSTLNGCPIIVHYENANYAGATATTYTSGSLSTISGYMNNRTTSIIYTS